MEHKEDHWVLLGVDPETGEEIHVRDEDLTPDKPSGKPKFGAKPIPREPASNTSSSRKDFTFSGHVQTGLDEQEERRERMVRKGLGLPPED